MYSFAQRPDTRVIDEPLYAAFLQKSARADEHPGAAEVMAEQPHAMADAVRIGMSNDCDRPVYFIKNMAQHWAGFDADLLENYENVLLFRHPALVARSFDKVVAAPTPEDLGFPQQMEILDALIARKLPVIAVNSAAVRNFPEETLKDLCGKLGIDFKQEMLSWKAGEKDYDGVWAKYWYGNVHQSTGFAPDHAEVPAIEDLPENLREVVVNCLPYYQRLSEAAVS